MRQSFGPTSEPIVPERRFSVSLTENIAPATLARKPLT
jgi:hypothetical protein